MLFDQINYSYSSILLNFLCSLLLNTNNLFLKKIIKTPKMPRKKTKHAPIPSDRERNSTCKKRIDGLFKKANELSILCGVEISIIIQHPSEGNLILWPSRGDTEEGVAKFLSFSGQERLKKMVLNENYLMARVSNETEKLMKLQKKTEEKQMECLMDHLVDVESIDELDIRQLNGLFSLAGEKLKMLQDRKDVLDKKQGQPTDVLPHRYPSFQNAGAKKTNEGQSKNPVTALMEDTRKGDLFVHAVSGKNIPCLLNGKDTETKPTQLGRSFAGNQGELPDDLNQV